MYSKFSFQNPILNLFAVKYKDKAKFTFILQFTIWSSRYLTKFFEKLLKKSKSSDIVNQILLIKIWLM